MKTFLKTWTYLKYYTNMTPTDFNRLKAEQRATYEMAKLIKKRYRATGTGATPQQTVDGKKYLPYTKYTKT